MYREQTAAQLDRMDNFTGILSHDLRNPLTVAQGHLDTAQESADSEDLRIVEIVVSRRLKSGKATVRERVSERSRTRWTGRRGSCRGARGWRGLLRQGRWPGDSRRRTREPLRGGVLDWRELTRKGIGDRRERRDRTRLGHHCDDGF